MDYLDTYISEIYRNTAMERNILNDRFLHIIENVFSFSKQLLSKTFPILRRI
jgi:hypothetical protein